jgi:Zn-dependent peptidase ImmA (M78 family)
MQINPENLNEITNESEYYRQMKLLAQEKRVEFNVGSNKIGLKFIREIYKKEGIIIDYRDIKSPRIKAIYFCDDEPSVGIKRSLPNEPKIFSLIHELKHHFVDKENILNCDFVCGDYNENKKVEIGAEVFAAEFIFPELEMQQSLADFGITKGTITHKKVVEYKMNCGVPISYKFIEKRLERFRIIEKGSYSKVQFQKLENELFPNPFKRTKKKSI